MQTAAAGKHMEDMHHRSATATCVPYQAHLRHVLRALDEVSWLEFQQSLGAAGPKPLGRTSSVQASLGLACNEDTPPKMAFQDHVAPSRASATYLLPPSPRCGKTRSRNLAGHALR